MAVSRPLLLTLVGAMLMASTFLAARGARETAAEPAKQAVVPPSGGKANAAGGKPPAANKANADGKAGDPAKSRSDKAKKVTPAREPKQKPKPAAPPEGGAGAAVPGVPGPVARALARRQVIVLFFRQSAADDSATAAAVKGVRGTKGVAVFQAPIIKLAKYRGLVSELGIAQAPVVVIVDRAKQAQLIEGYVDPASLKQLVQDAR